MGRILTGPVDPVPMDVCDLGLQKNVYADGMIPGSGGSGGGYDHPGWGDTDPAGDSAIICGMTDGPGWSIANAR